MLPRSPKPPPSLEPERACRPSMPITIGARRGEHDGRGAQAGLRAQRLRHRLLAVTEHVLEDPVAVGRPRIQVGGAVEIAGDVVEDGAVVVLLDRLLEPVPGAASCCSPARSAGSAALIACWVWAGSAPIRAPI